MPLPTIRAALVGWRPAISSDRIATASGFTRSVATSAETKVTAVVASSPFAARTTPRYSRSYGTTWRGRGGLNVCPISNNRIAGLRWSALCPSTRSMPGSKLVRRTDSSATIGFASATATVDRPDRERSAGERNVDVQTSSQPFATNRSAVFRRAFWYGVNVPTREFVSACRSTLPYP